jgi:hypothetical protein
MSYQAAKHFFQFEGFDPPHLPGDTTFIFMFHLLYIMHFCLSAAVTQRILRPEAPPLVVLASLPLTNNSRKLLHLPTTNENPRL